ncbi:MAG TPA: cyclic nucleotide-binding domain-containing protein, partial [Myxococcota bacterium]|nr:cyclic nucleotide-binding domain-containing protein [Myxococcota bacterium]
MSSGRAFLAKLGPRNTARLLSAGSPVELQPGARLIRRGEKGGDIYVIESGTLEIVDDRFHPEVVLDWAAAGDVVGDM